MDELTKLKKQMKKYYIENIQYFKEEYAKYSKKSKNNEGDAYYEGMADAYNNSAMYLMFQFDTIRFLLNGHSTKTPTRKPARK